MGLKKQALAIFLTLSGQAKEAAPELEVDVINADDGVNKLLEKLDGLYLKDFHQTTYQAYDTFEKFQRGQTMTVQEYIIEFERLYHKLKAHNMELPDCVCTRLSFFSQC